MKPTKWIPSAASTPLGVVGWFQEFPRGELGFGYSYVRYASSAVFTKSHSFNGGGGTLVFNLNQYPGLKADPRGNGSTTNTFLITPCPLFPSGAAANVQGNLFTYLFGPQVKVCSLKVQPFVHLLFGGAHSNVYANAFKIICTTGIGACAFSAAPASNAFAMVFGGAIDIPVGHAVSIRPAGVDICSPTLPIGSTTPIRTISVIPAGINFNLGARANKSKWRLDFELELVHHQRTFASRCNIDKWSTT